MSTTTITTYSQPRIEDNDAYPEMKRTARITGLWYLALAIVGMLGFLLIRPQIHAEGDAATTLANLLEQPGLARLGLVLEMALVVTQAAAAVWFYKLFHRVSATAAWALAGFGTVNAIAIMTSAVFVATAIAVAGNPGLAPGGDAAATVQLLYDLSVNSWAIGALFFGLWLIPMGYLAIISGFMPKWLGRILVIGGFAYVLEAFLAEGWAEAPLWLVDGALAYVATVGELWMIGYLLTVGVRRSAFPVTRS